MALTIMTYIVQEPSIPPLSKLVRNGL